MTYLNRSLIISASLLLFSTVLVACGGDDLECGERTIAEDGSCVPNTSEIRRCGEGTEVNADGECVLATGGCSASTSFDSERGRCVPSSDTCGDGTEFDAESGTCVGVTGCGENTVQNDNGTCVPDVGTLCADQPGVQYDPESGNCTVAAGSCGPGTQLSAQSGTCVISDAACDQGLTINDDGNCVPTDEVCGEQSTLAEVDGAQICVPSATCQEDDVVLMPAQSGQGVCVDPAQTLANNPDRTESEQPDNSGEQNNDVDTGGNPDPISVKPTGETTAVVGTIGPPVDRDGDDQPEQDQDTFTFQGQAGQWFNVSVQSLGLPHGWFQVFGPNGFEREAQLGLQGNPARQIVLPYDGEYEIEIMTAEHAFDTNGDVGPAGEPSWGYVLALEQIAPSMPTDVDFSSNNASGQLSPITENLYRVNGFNNGDLVQVTADSIGAGAQDIAVLSLWRSSTEPLKVQEVNSGESLIFTYQTDSNGNAPILHIDWKYAVGPDIGYQVSAEATTDVEDLGAIAPDTSATGSTRSIADEDRYLYTFSAQAGQVIELAHTNDEDEDLEVTVSEIGSGEVYDESTLPVSNDIPNFENDEGYFYVDQSGEFLVDAFADNGELPNFELTVHSRSPIQTVTGLQAGDSFPHQQDRLVAPNRTEWLSFSTADTVALNGVVRKLQPTGSSPDFDVAAYSADSTKELEFNDLFEVGNDGDIADITDETDLRERVLTPGKYLIGFRMEDPTVDRYEFDFSLPGVLTESEPNDSLSQATSITLGAEVLGTAEEASGGDTLDYFKLTLDQPLGSQEVLYFNATSDGLATNHWRCNILDSSGSVLKEYHRHEPNGDGGDEGCMVFLDSASAGTYYFEIRYDDTFGSDDYTLESQRVAGVFESEPNDSRTDANQIAFSDFKNGTDVYGHGIPGTEETDFWELNLSGGGSVSDFEAQCDSIGPDPDDLDFFLYDQADNELDSDTFAESAALASGSVSNSDAPFALEIVMPDTNFSDNLYRCSYQSP